jgi:hypothetical protein
MALKNRLTPDQMHRAIEMKASGKTWDNIAEEMGMDNTPALQGLIRDTLREADVQFAANFEFMILLDLMRIEDVMPENQRLAKDGSHQHVGAFAKLIKLKMDVLTFYMDLLRVKAETQGDKEDHTFTRDSEEYRRAVTTINQQIQQGIYADPDEADEEGDVSPSALTTLNAEDLAILREQVDQVELMIGGSLGQEITEAASS